MNIREKTAKGPPNLAGTAAKGAPEGSGTTATGAHRRSGQKKEHPRYPEQHQKEHVGSVAPQQAYPAIAHTALLRITLPGRLNPGQAGSSIGARNYWTIVFPGNHPADVDSTGFKPTCASKLIMAATYPSTALTPLPSNRQNNCPIIASCKPTCASTTQHTPGFRNMYFVDAMICKRC